METAKKLDSLKVFTSKEGDQKIPERIIKSDMTIVLLGERGVGKTVRAEEIHKISGRLGKFVPVNCASLTKDLADSLLFGHKKGAFTGAINSEPGFFKTANKGTLFLDEICDLPLISQGKILTVLDNGVFLPLGYNKPEKVDVRIIAATNKDIFKEKREKRFRDDLYSRLSQFVVTIPPLRKRKGDIKFLISDLTTRYMKEHDSKAEISRAAFAALLNYDWPGNVRELKNVLKRIFVMHHEGEVGRDEIIFDSEVDSETSSLSVEQGRDVSFLNGRILALKDDIKVLNEKLSKSDSEKRYLHELIAYISSFRLEPVADNMKKLQEENETKKNQNTSLRRRIKDLKRQNEILIAFLLGIKNFEIDDFLNLADEEINQERELRAGIEKDLESKKEELSRTLEECELLKNKLIINNIKL